MFSRCKTCKVRSKLSEAEQNMLQVLMFRKDVSDYQVFRTFKEHGIDVSHDSFNYYREHCLEPIRKKVEETYEELEKEQPINLEDYIVVKRGALNGVRYPFATNLLWMEFFKAPSPSPVFALTGNTCSPTANG